MDLDGNGGEMVMERTGVATASLWCVRLLAQRWCGLPPRKGGWINQLTVHCTLTSRASKSVPVIVTGSYTFQPSGSASGPRITPPSAYASARSADGGFATLRGRNAKFVDNLYARHNRRQPTTCAMGQG